MYVLAICLFAGLFCSRPRGITPIRHARRDQPAGKATQYFQYTNPATGVTYPDTFAPAIPVVGNYKTPPELTLHFIDSKTYDKTNLAKFICF